MYISVFIAQSIDGKIAAPDDDISWLENYQPAEGENFGYEDFITKIDCIIMGRKTYEKVMSFEKWPYKIPVIVVSTTLKKIETDKITIAYSLDEALKYAESKRYKRIYADGGKMISSMLKIDIIDEIILTTIPVILGEGTRLFTDTGIHKCFELDKVERFQSGIIQSRYVRGDGK